MKKLVVYLGIVLILFAVSESCSKSGGGGSGCDGEAALNFTSTPALNSTEPPAPGPDFGVTVKITNLPAAGATIVVTAKPENPASATPFFTQTVNTTTSSTDVTITGTPLATSAIVSITVTSKSCATNTKNGTYRYSRK
jgi:hypothetical protein